MSSVPRRETVLVLDDEPQVLSAIEDTLEGLYLVLVQTSPRIAMRIVENEPDLSVILSDQRMPGMTGDEFFARAREISDASRVMITGYAELAAVVRAINHGKIFSYISKPWDSDQLRLVTYKAVEHHRLLRELSAEQRLLHNLMDNIPDEIFFKDREHRFVRLNKAYAARLGVARPEDAVGRSTRDVFPLDEALEREAEDDEVVLRGVTTVDRVRQISTPQGEVRWHSTTKAPIRDEHGKGIGLVGIARDITERQRAEQKVRRLSRVHAVMSGINALIVRVHDQQELFREACQIAVEAGQFAMAWVGVLDEEAQAIRPVAWRGGDEEFIRSIPLRLDETDPVRTGLAIAALREARALVTDDMARDPRVRVQQEAANRNFHSSVILPLLVEGKPVGIMAVYAFEIGFFDDEEMKLLRDLAGDISFALDHIDKERRLNYLAMYDEVTGLANRSLFQRQLEQTVNTAAREGQVCAVLCVNLSRFREINHSLGRAASDALLRQVAERIQAAVRGTDQVARISADQFAVLFPDVKGEREVARLVEEMTRRWFGTPFLVEEHELRVSAKVGIALYPSDGADAETLFRNSEAALNRARAKGEPYLFYTQSMTERIAEKLTLENRLRRALEREEFVLHYQPKIDLDSRSITGAEALIRWMSPDLGLVPPGKFIGLLEDTGMILEVGAWALRRAVLDRGGWAREGLAAPRVAVNVSAIQLRRREFVDVVKEAMRHDAGAQGLDLEVTESVLMDDVAANIEKLGALREFGVQVAIDDFGTGYSSLAYLAKLPVHALKIDRSFVITMLDDPNVLTLVSTILSLAQSLRLKVVAEGVDAEEQAKMLRLLRCDEMQGFLFSPPLPFEKISALLRQTEVGR